jgi:hypothetical protein
VPLSVPVECRIGRRRVTLRIKDVASGGVFIKTPDTLTCGTRIETRFPLPDPEGAEGVTNMISATCEVVRLVTAEEGDLIAGVGASFVQIERADARLIERYVAAARV